MSRLLCVLAREEDPAPAFGPGERGVGVLTLESEREGVARKACPGLSEGDCIRRDVDAFVAAGFNVCSVPC